MSSPSVLSWGRGNTGQLGLGGRASLLGPRPLAQLDGLEVVELSCGDWHSAAVTEAGELYAWGSGRLGQMGNNSWVGAVSPQRVELLASVRVKQVSCGGGHTMVLTDEAAVYSWGWGKHGQLGHGDCCNLRVPQLLQPFTQTAVRLVAAGERFSAAVDGAGGVWTWGDGSLGQLGRPDDKACLPGQVPVDALGEVVAVSAGSGHVGAVCTDGSVFVWGDNTQGQLGTMSSADAAMSPVRLESLEEQIGTACVVGFSCGKSVSIVAGSDGSCFAWGCPVSGQLAMRSRRLAVPTRIDFGPGVQIDQVAAGAHHLMACSRDSLWCWGHGGDGRLGLGSEAIQPEPVQVTALAGMEVLLMEGGNAHSMVLVLGDDTEVCGYDALPVRSTGLNAGLPKQSSTRTAAGKSAQLQVHVIDGRAMIDEVAMVSPDQPVGEGEWLLSGFMQPEGGQPSELLAEVELKDGRFRAEQACVSSSWEGQYDADTGKVTWSSAHGGGRQYFEGSIGSDGIEGEYSTDRQEEGSFKLQLKSDGQESASAIVSRQREAQIKAKMSSYRSSENAMRADLNLAALDKDNLLEELVQLKARAEAAESEIDHEREFRRRSDDKCDRLSELMIGFRLREEALARQLKEKDQIARRALDAFHGLRAECATLLGAAASAAFDEDGAELEALQAKLSELSKSPPPATRSR